MHAKEQPFRFKATIFFVYQHTLFIAKRFLEKAFFEVCRVLGES